MHDSGYGGLAGSLLDTYFNDSLLVNHPRQGCAARGYPARYGFPCQRRRVQERCALYDFAVQWDPLSGFHDDYVPDINAVRVNDPDIVASVIIAHLQIGGVRTDSHEACNSLPGSVECKVLKVFADSEEQHNTDSFRQPVDCEGAQCRHAHKEEFIEYLAAKQIRRSLAQHLTADKQVSGDENNIFHEYVRCPVELRFKENANQQKDCGYHYRCRPDLRMVMMSVAMVTCIRFV